uniref:Uncharacterized protein n=1 Tax=Solanum tuberosum TaxID=4113 RepID=M1DXT3_SOLTU
MGLIAMIMEDTWLFLEIESPWYKAFCANNYTNPLAMRTSWLLILLMFLQGLDTKINPFQEGEDDNVMDSKDHVKSLEELDGHQIKTYNVLNVHQTDHSALLVRIADQLGDSPFGVVHCRLAPAFNIVVLWVSGRHGTTSRNFSAMQRLLPFSSDLILSFKAQHTGKEGEVRPFGDLLSGHDDPQAFISPSFSAFSFLFAT